MNRIFQIELYPIPLPANCEVLKSPTTVKVLHQVSQHLLEEMAQTGTISQEPIFDFANPEVLSYTHHFEVIVHPTFNWHAAWGLLKKKFPYIAWTKVGKESIGSHDIYSYEFIPFVNVEGTLSMSFGKYVEAAYPNQSEPKQCFVHEVTEITNSPECWTLEEEYGTADFLDSENPKKPQRKKKRKSVRKEEGSGAGYTQSANEKNMDSVNIPQLLEELKNQHNAKERMSLANQKMEILVAQIENYNMQRSMEELSNAWYGENDWAKRLKISLREYSIIMQKSRFLEQLWMINRDLETRIERMTVSDSQLTYEREQVKRLKERLSPHEIFLVIDECQEIEKRCKIRSRIPWVRPYVEMMQMDYDSLNRKAQYFDLLQGENVLLDSAMETGDPK